MAALALDAWPLVGRNGIRRRARELIGGGRGVIFAGPAGVGKSTLARDLADTLDARDDTPVTRIAATASLADPIAAIGSIDQHRRTRVVVDDIHLLDDDSAALLHGLVTARRIDLIATMRSGEPTSSAIVALWKDDHVERFDLDDLPRDDVDELLDRVLDAPIAAGTRSRIWELTRGSPMLLRELLRAAIEEHSLALVDGMWCMDASPQAVRLDEIVAERLADLNTAAREIVEIVALGEPLGVDLLLRHQPIDALADAEASGLIEVVQDGMRRDVRTVHPLYGEIAVRRLGAGRTARRSGQLLAMIETTPMRRRDDIVRATTWQLRAGGEAVSSDMVLAARRALYDNQERLAIELATRAVGDAHLDATLVLGEALVGLGDHQRAEEVLRDAPDGSDAHGALVAMQRSVALFWGLADVGRADEVLRDAEASLPPGAWRDECRAERAVIGATAGRFGEALELVGPILGGPAQGRAFATAAIAGACAYALGGRPNLAQTIAEQGLAASADIGEAPVMSDPGIYIVAQALAMSEAGDLAGAAELSSTARDVSITEGMRDGQAWFSLVLGRIRLMSGHLSAAAALFAEAAGSFAALHSDGPRRWALAGSAMAAAMRGDHAAAQDAHRGLIAVGTHPVAMMEGEVERAGVWLSASSGNRSGAAEAAIEVAERCFARGEVGVGAAAAHDAVRLDGSVPSDLAERVASAEGALAEARHLAITGMGNDDLERLAAAETRFATMGADLHAAEVATRCAESHARRGDHRAEGAARRRASEHQQHSGEEWALTLDRPVAPVALTRREQQTAELAALGWTNRKIASELVVSVRTVENHLQRAFQKLGVHGRDEVAGALAVGDISRLTAR
ncbi:MAG: LuxR C-terminal-related transcriptional regulator [Actinomycetota bacterium]